MPRSFLSLFLVAAQFTLLAVLLLSGPIWPAAPWWLLWPAALILAGWSIAVLRLSRLSVWPDPLPQVELVTDGPYHWIRHPIYSALLLGGLAAALAGGPAWRWLIWGALLLVLMVKLQHEERLLSARLPDYTAYCLRTKRLLPYLW